MSKALRLLVSSAEKILMRQNAIQPASMAARNGVTQAKPAGRFDDSFQEYGEYEDMRTHNEAFRVDMTSTGDTLNINLENFTKDLQKEIVDQLGLFLSADTDLDKIKNVSFCSVSEEVYRQKLYMPFRKLGYSCVFTRYNDDRGRAIFKLEDATENNVKRSYYRTGLPNKY